MKPGTSLSVVVTSTVCEGSTANADAEPAFTDTVTWLSTSPSIRKSFTPFTVSACGTFQLAEVNVSVAGLTAASVPSLLETPKTTFVSGWRASTTVNVCEVPDSLTVSGPPVTVKPATSLSVAVTLTVLSASGSNWSCEAASFTATLTVLVTAPSTVGSSTAVTVTVCGVFQVAFVNVSVVGATVTWVASSLETAKTTSETGLAVSTTVNVPGAAPSATVSVAGVTANPATSLSVVVTGRVWFATPSNWSSELAASTPMVSVVIWLPSTRSSSTPVTVTVCATFQLPLVNVSLSVSGPTVASPLSPLVTNNTTSLVAGCAVSATVNAAVVPVSLTESAPAVIVKPTASSSIVVTLTSWSGTAVPP